MFPFQRMTASVEFAGQYGVEKGVNAWLQPFLSLVRKSALAAVVG